MKTVGAMLAGDIGAIAFELPEPPDGELVRCAVSDRGTTENLDARFLSLGGGRALMTVKLRGADGAVSVRTATRSYELGALGGIIGELQPFVAELAALDEVARIELAGFLAGTQSGHGELKLARALSDRLVEIHAAVRTKRSGARIERGGRIGLQVEALIAADRTTFYARGWLASRDGAPVRLTAVSPEGARVELIDRLYRYPRTDVAELYGDEPAEELVTPSGFAASFEIPAPSLREGGWTFELEDSAGLCVETSEQEFVHGATVRMRLLGELGFEPPYGRELVSRHLHPVLHKLQARHAADVSVADVREYGTRPEDPDVSVVVPLYRRTDFIQHQLAQFALDGEFERVDLVYVLDSPELAHDLDFTAQQLHDLYRIPFSVVVMARNSGFSAANNAGAAHARGRLLLLLNSDVLPAEPGWLSKLVAFHDATPDIGALSGKLLYEDDTIQHAGMYVDRDPRTRLWRNEHYFKGLHRGLPAANVARPVTAVTGACLLIDRSLYLADGGLSGAYIHGDYEDSDLCLRLIEAGRQNWYCPDAELYHLEAQSYPGHLRELVWRYNAWLHSQVWSERLRDVDPHDPSVSVTMEQL